MATYTFPYPAGTVNRAAHYITRDGDDLLMHFAPRDAAVDVFDRFVGYYTIDWAAVNAQAGTPMQAPTSPGGYVSPSGVVTNGSAVVPVVAPAPSGVPGVVTPPETTPAPAASSASGQSVREGNDLLIYYPNGAVDRFRDYFNPQGSAQAVNDAAAGELPPNPNPGGFSKPLASSVRTGNDRYVTFTDGTQKILTNFFLPHIPNSEAENNGAYTFGTGVTDPEYMKLYGKFPDQKFLVQDRQDGTDRVAIYSDGTAKRLPGWYADPANAGFLVTQAPDAPDPVFFEPDNTQTVNTPPITVAPPSFVPPIFVGANPNYTTGATTPAGVPPSSVTLPPQLSGNATGGVNVARDVTPSPLVPVAPLPGAPPAVSQDAVILALIAIAALLAS